MDWSKTKSIFIVTFLVLDLFLAYQFIKKHDQDQYSLFVESSVEEQLAAEGITYNQLPKNISAASSLNGKSKTFNEEELKTLKKQKASLLDEQTIESILDEPIPLPEKNTKAKLKQFLKEYVFSGESYTFWSMNKERNLLTFYQRYNGKTIYDNESGIVVVHLNEKNEIVSYEQTLLENIEKLDDKQEVLLPIKAIENLYLKEELKANSKVTKVELGYYTFDLPLPSSQVLAPTWHIIVNENTHYFVNAFEGQIIQKSTK
ncbi:regulator [Priestia megaterium]|nr:regulator [Priestia megaterium]